jgi:hypothetical protein
MLLVDKLKVVQWTDDTPEIINSVSELLQQGNYGDPVLISKIERIAVGKFEDTSTQKNTINYGNVLVDDHHDLWVIDFGSASNKEAPPKGGTKRRRKSTRKKLKLKKP